MIQHIWRKYRAHVEVRGEDDAFNRLGRVTHWPHGAHEVRGVGQQGGVADARDEKCDRVRCVRRRCLPFRVQLAPRDNLAGGAHGMQGAPGPLVAVDCLEQDRSGHLGTLSLGVRLSVLEQGPLSARRALIDPDCGCDCRDRPDRLHHGSGAVPIDVGPGPGHLGLNRTTPPSAPQPHPTEGRSSNGQRCNQHCGGRHTVKQRSPLPLAKLGELYRVAQRPALIEFSERHHPDLGRPRPSRHTKKTLYSHGFNQAGECGALPSIARFNQFHERCQFDRRQLPYVLFSDDQPVFVTPDAVFQPILERLLGLLLGGHHQWRWFDEAPERRGFGWGRWIETVCYRYANRHDDAHSSEPQPVDGQPLVEAKFAFPRHEQSPASMLTFACPGSQSLEAS